MAEDVVMVWRDYNADGDLEIFDPAERSPTTEKE
jgi:hypothetical protein